MNCNYFKANVVALIERRAPANGNRRAPRALCCSPLGAAIRIKALDGQELMNALIVTIRDAIHVLAA